MAADGYARDQQEESGRLRMLTYMIAKPYLKDENMTVFEFWPLEGDPTPDEITEEQQERLGRELEEARKRRERILSKFKQRNGGI